VANIADDVVKHLDLATPAESSMIAYHSIVHRRDEMKKIPEASTFPIQPIDAKPKEPEDQKKASSLPLSLSFPLQHPPMYDHECTIKSFPDESAPN